MQFKAPHTWVKLARGWTVNQSRKLQRIQLISVTDQFSSKFVSKIEIKPSNKFQALLFYKDVGNKSYDDFDKECRTFFSQISGICFTRTFHTDPLQPISSLDLLSQRPPKLSIPNCLRVTKPKFDVLQNFQLDARKVLNSQLRHLNSHTAGFHFNETLEPYYRKVLQKQQFHSS